MAAPAAIPLALGPPSAAALLAVPGQVDCSAPLLAPYCGAPSVRGPAALHLPSPAVPVQLRTGVTVRAAQIEGGRPSYLLALLVQVSWTSGPYEPWLTRT
ncbi:MAG: hypothetical protein M1833_006953 [Piccolia ochrophora]|nr:MAG: hypothetical protein M1833_006953 [Piccolia ochrophora]